MDVVVEMEMGILTHLKLKPLCGNNSSINGKMLKNNFNLNLLNVVPKNREIHMFGSQAEFLTTEEIIHQSIRSTLQVPLIFESNYVNRNRQEEVFLSK